MKFVIIGNGVAGITAALTIRKREPRAEITVISGETDFFFSRTALMYAFMDKMSRRDLEPYERDVWSKQRIGLLRGWVTDLNANTRTLRLGSGKEIAWDRLLIATGSAANRIPWKGLEPARSGVVNFVTMQDLDQCERLTKPGGNAVVVGGGLIGVELVECLRFHRMNVVFLVREPWYWPMALGEEEGRMIGAHIASHGVDLRIEEQIREVDADEDGRLRGIVTKSGEYLPCDLFGVTAGVRPAVGWLHTVETPPEIGRGVVAGADFATSLKNVWAAGDVAEIHREGHPPLIEQIWYSAKRQGEQAALSMLGDEIGYRPPLYHNSSKFFDIEYTTVGKAVEFPAGEGSLASRIPAGSRSFFYRVPAEEVTMRFVEKNGKVIGFNMLGTRWNHAVFERWIHERRGLDYVVDHLHEAQFDVEFGRQPLGGLRVAYKQWLRSVSTGEGRRERILQPV